MTLFRPHTPPIRGPRGRALPGSVAELTKVELGGFPQAVLIRGRSRENPVLLFLHGGPGMPAMYLAHRFQRGLERDVTVVHWDRRGAGKSYDPTLPLETLNVEQVISDTIELIGLLRRRFGQEKVLLLGHSWGSYLGMLVTKRHPELVRAYVGVGQMSHSRARELEVQDRFFRRTAKTLGLEKEVLADLAARGQAAHEKWLFRFGGELYHERSMWPLIKWGLAAPEYGLRDVMNVPRGSQLNLKHMRDNAIKGALADEVTSVEVPVYFFTGRHDYTVPFELTEEYFGALKAPAKKLVWFEDSAHFPFLEEPSKFAEELRAVRAET